WLRTWHSAQHWIVEFPGRMDSWPCRSAAERTWTPEGLAPPRARLRFPAALAGSQRPFGRLAHRHDRDPGVCRRRLLVGAAQPSEVGFLSAKHVVHDLFEVPPAPARAPLKIHIRPGARRLVES